LLLLLLLLLLEGVASTSTSSSWELLGRPKHYIAVAADAVGGFGFYFHQFQLGIIRQS
jgi:hypothetical protein